MLGESDGASPVIELDPLPSDLVTNAIFLTGTISNDNLAEYKFEVAPIGSNDFVTIFTGTENVTDGVLGSFDPTLLLNDSYTLRVTAKDTSGLSSEVSETVDVGGDLKLGNFQLSFTDLTVPVSGIPISVTRTYDSIGVAQQDDFGPGWRLEFRDTDLRTSLGPDETYETFGIRENAFTDNTRVYVTLPGGKRETFTFSPKRDRLSRFVTGPNGEGGLFHPAFKAQDGSHNTLTVRDVLLTRNPNGEYVALSGTPYNPENSFFGGSYTLTTKEGIVYEISAKTGDLLTVRDRNGNTLTYTDEGIFSDTGVSVTFERDAIGRITSVIDPAGEKIVYSYDAVTGDLVGVRDRANNTTTLEYEAQERPHYLTGINDPLGREAVRNEYDESGRLTRILDVNGSAVELEYDRDNSTQTVKDVFGNPTTYVYDERGNVLTEVDPLGLVTLRTYDDDNNVLTETVITDESGPEGYTTTYTYDRNGNKLTETDALGNVTRWSYNQRGQVLTETDPLGNTTRNSYSLSGNLLSSQDAAGNRTEYGYDIRGNLLSMTNAAGNITEFQYDESGNATFVRNPLDNETSFTYDQNGNRLSKTQTVTMPNGAEELVTRWTYDFENRVTSITDAENNTTRYEYDKNGNRVLKIDALSRHTAFRYDDKNQLVETIYPDDTPDDDEDNLRTITLYDKGGRRRATIDEAGRVTHYNYDDAGQLVETIYPDETDSLEQLINEIAPGETSATIDWTAVVYPKETPAYVSDNPRSSKLYDQQGETLADIDPLGNRTEYRYNGLNQLVEMIAPDDIPETKDDNPRTTYSYDEAGRKISETDELNQTTSYVFNNRGLLEKTIFADGSFTTTGYDVLGRQNSFTDQLGITTEYRYDALGQLTGVKDALGNWTEYGYDEVGRQIWQEDALDRRTLYEYDKIGRRTVVELPMGQREGTVYDPVGNVVSTTDFNQDTINFSYDPLNRLISKTFPDNTEVNFTYTPTGRMSTVTDDRGTTSYEYDIRDRLISRTDPTGVYLPSSATIEYDYDDAGNRTLVRTPGGETEYSYDSRNRLVQVTDSSQGVTRYEYNGVNNLIQTVLPNGVVENRVYDSLNRLDFLENKLDDTVISSYNYTLDAMGNRVSVLEHTGRLVEYEYDPLYRLTSETISGDPDGDNRVITYTYDKVSNRLTRDDSVEGLTSYTYDDNDQLQTETLVKNEETVYTREYDYDDNGNTTSVLENGSETTYSWDYENRLIGATTPDAVERSYSYDSDGVRVSSTVGGETTEYLVDKNRPYAQVLEEHVDGEIAVRYVHGLDLISQSNNGQQSVYLVDGLGSTRVLADESGGVISNYTYNAFGSLINSTGGTENKYLFAGEQFNSELEQYYLRARYYDPSLGRFTRRDTYEGDVFEPVTLHKYLYGNANPVTYIDPTGLFSLAAAASVFSILDTLIKTTLKITESIVTAFIPLTTCQSYEIAEDHIFYPDVDDLFGSITGFHSVVRAIEGTHYYWVEPPPISAGYDHYRTTFGVPGNAAIKESSFFPELWNAEDVLRKIREAYDKTNCPSFGYWEASVPIETIPLFEIAIGGHVTISWGTKIITTAFPADGGFND